MGGGGAGSRCGGGGCGYVAIGWLVLLPGHHLQVAVQPLVEPVQRPVGDFVAHDGQGGYFVVRYPAGLLQMVEEELHRWVRHLDSGQEGVDSICKYPPEPGHAAHVRFWKRQFQCTVPKMFVCRVDPGCCSHRHASVILALVVRQRFADDDLRVVQIGASLVEDAGE